MIAVSDGNRCFYQWLVIRHVLRGDQAPVVTAGDIPDIFGRAILLYALGYRAAIPEIKCGIDARLTVLAGFGVIENLLVKGRDLRIAEQLSASGVTPPGR